MGEMRSMYTILVGKPKEKVTRKTVAQMGVWNQNGSWVD
jgi:hypothetical protein